MARLPISLATLAIGLALGTPGARAQGTDARDLAQKQLDEGARLFDRRDAKAMAETYAEDAVLSLLSYDAGSGQYKNEEFRGRQAIEENYKKLFDGLNGNTTSKNTVETARLLGSRVLIITGTFQLDISNGLTVPFSQIRIKVGEKWLKQKLTVYLVPEG
ncbi:MAG: hypothetical protein U0800_26715 [Isosphaeraceae bacterium]